MKQIFLLATLIGSVYCHNNPNVNNDILTMSGAVLATHYAILPFTNNNTGMQFNSLNYFTASTSGNYITGFNNITITPIPNNSIFTASNLLFSMNNITQETSAINSINTNQSSSPMHKLKLSITIGNEPLCENTIRNNVNQKVFLKKKRRKNYTTKKADEIDNTYNKHNCSDFTFKMPHLVRKCTFNTKDNTTNEKPTKELSNVVSEDEFYNNESTMFRPRDSFQQEAKNLNNQIYKKSDDQNHNNPINKPLKCTRVYDNTKDSHNDSHVQISNDTSKLGSFK